MIKTVNCRNLILVVLLLWFGLSNFITSAQPCQCINCPGTIPKAGIKDFSTTEFLYFVNGASSNALEDPFQGVCAVNLSFKADNIFQIEMYLISPGGDTVALICPDAGPGVGVTALTTWNISFVPNSITAFPDPGFNSTWTNYDPWQTGVNYTGTYHPCSDALEDFNSGPVNGPWRLLVKNYAPLNKGEILDFSIVFCDETGIECGCLAYAGIFPAFKLIDACQGATSLNLNLTPNYNGYIPDSTMYNYTYTIASPNNTILEFSENPNLTSYPIGNYKVCGLSYLKMDSSLVIKGVGVIKLDSIYSEINSPNPDYCADLSKNCIFVNINPSPPTKVFNYFLCKDSCIQFEGNNYCNPGTFDVSKIDSLGCKLTYTLNLQPALPKFSTILDTICKGEFTILGTDFLNKTGVYTKVFKSFTGCDSLVTLKLTVIDFNLDILPPDTLNCANSQVLLDGSDSNGFNSSIKYSWTASNGGKIIGNNSNLDLTVQDPGTYTLTGKYTFQSGKTCQDAITIDVIKNLIPPELSNVPDQFLCLGEDRDLSKLNIKEIHDISGTITYHSATPPTILNQILPLVQPSISSVFYAYFKAGICEDILPINIFVNKKPNASVKSYVNICNSNLNGNNTKIKFDSLIVSGDATGFWIDSDLSGATGSFPTLDFSGVPPGTYDFVYFTQSAVPPCADTFYIVNIIVEDCECPSLATLTPGDLCNNNANFNLDLLLITSESGNWSLLNAPFGSTATIIGNSFQGNGSIPGNYTIRFTLIQPPPNGCASYVDLSFEIKSPPLLQLMPDITVCNSDEMGSTTVVDLNNLILSIDKSGKWTDLDNSGAVGFFPLLDFKDITPGTYKFKYSTNSAEYPCNEMVDTIDVIVKDCSCPNVNILSTSICNENGTVQLDNLVVTGQTGTWQISSYPAGSNPASINMNSFVIFNSDPGLYGLKFILTNPTQGCQSEFNTNINLIKKPFTLIDTIAMVCNNNQNGNTSILDLSKMLKGGDVTGTWLEVIPSGASGTLPILDFNGISAGDYYFKYTTNSGSSPCNETEYIVRIIVEDCVCPSVATTKPGKFCTDNLSVNLDDYKVTNEPGTWAIIMQPPGSNPANVSLNIFNGVNADAGNYLVQFTLLNTPPIGCPVSSTQTIEVVPAPFANLIQTASICNGNSSGQPTSFDFNTLIVSGDLSGTWSEITGSGASGTLPVLDFDGVVPGKYIFRYETSALVPCNPKTYDVTIDVVNCECPPIISANIPSICNDVQSIDLSAFVSIGVGTSLVKVPNGQSISILQNNILQTKGIIPGTYSLLANLQVQPPVGCAVDTIVYFDVSEMKSAGIKLSDLSFCEGSDTILNLFDLISGEDSGGTWSILPFTSSFNSNSNTLSINTITAGDFTLKYIQKNQIPCIDEEVAIKVLILKIPMADAGEDQSLGCGKSIVTLGGPLNGGLQNIDFNWSSNLIDNKLPNPQTSNPGLYQLVVTDLNNGCTDFDEVLITGNPDLEISAGYSIIQPTCKINSTGSISVGVTQGNPPYLYSINNGLYQSSSQFQNLLPGKYNVQIEDAAGCTKDTLIEIFSPNNLGLSLGNDTIIDFGDSLKLEPMFNFPISEIQSISWKGEGYLNCDTCLYPFVKPFKSTKYFVEVLTNSGCFYFADIIVNVKKEVRFFVPNVFSPNDDGINDFVELYLGSDISKVRKFQIYDRWGEQLFSGSNIANSGNSIKTWNGKLRGKKMNPGVFLYFMELEMLDGSVEIFSGEITLVN